MSISGTSEDWGVAKAGLYPANVLILIFLLANWLSRRSNRMLNLKGLVLLFINTVTIQAGVRGSQNKSPNANLPLRVPNPESRTPRNTSP